MTGRNISIFLIAAAAALLFGFALTLFDVVPSMQQVIALFSLAM